MTQKAAVAALRLLVEQRFPDAIPVAHRTTEQVRTGIAAFDRILPNGGFPRGKLSVWAPLGGATAILRAACYSTIALGERAAWIDTDGSFSGLERADGLVLFRPTTRLHGLRATEEVLRSGGFALVVLADAPTQGIENLRLSRAAHESGAALVRMTASTSLSSLRLTSQIDATGYRWQNTPFDEPGVVRDVEVRIQAQAMGWTAKTIMRIPVQHHELRLTLDTGLVDRRGALRATRATARSADDPAR